MLGRILGVFKLSVKTFEEVEADPGATVQAALVVVLAALLGGVGGGVLGSFRGGGGFVGGFLQAALTLLIGVALWSVLTYFVGTRLFGAQATVGEMFRVIGFGQAPAMLGIVPLIGGFVGGVWALIATFIGIRQGLDVSNGKTALTILIGFVVYVVLGLVFGAVTGRLGG